MRRACNSSGCFVLALPESPCLDGQRAGGWRLASETAATVSLQRSSNAGFKPLNPKRRNGSSRDSIGESEDGKKK
jgi:hypothetical protein